MALKEGDRIVVTPQDERLASYWRTRAHEYEYLLKDWERTIAGHRNSNSEDLRGWLDNVVDRLKRAHEQARRTP